MNVNASLAGCLRENASAICSTKARNFSRSELWAAYKMYEQWGNIAAAGAVAGIGNVAGVPCMIIANDATVKAGAFFPATAKKLIRAQRIAFECSLPIIYLVDSAGVFLPMQDEIFPDEDDFGRIFRNNSVISAAGIPQFAAIMGNCVAGGAYLPVLCDKILMTKGSGLYLAGPSLVKAAIGQVVDAEELGGAQMHAEISGTVDFYEKDDASCLNRLRSLVALLPEAETAKNAKIENENSEAGEKSGRALRSHQPRWPEKLRRARSARIDCRRELNRRIQGRLRQDSCDRLCAHQRARRSASSRTSVCKCGRKRKAFRWAASFIPTARIKQRGL